MNSSKPFTQPAVIRGESIDPPWFLAPMAGINHAPFRRLMSEFGGYGALFTEMVPAKTAVLKNPASSPHLRRRPEEGRVFYQLLLSPDDDVPAVVEGVNRVEPFALDVNLACPAPAVLKYHAGAGLYRDREGMVRILAALRQEWKGILTVKIRLGDTTPQWQEDLADRLRLFEELGIDAVILHPRYFHEKLKRRARREIFAWATGQTKVPMIANGDIVSAADASSPAFASTAGLMVGRIAIAQPWFFRILRGDEMSIDYWEVWERLYSYITEEYPPPRAVGRIKDFTAYYARNFFFGHLLFRQMQGAQDLETIYTRAKAFLTADPRTVKQVAVDGV